MISMISMIKVITTMILASCIMNPMYLQAEDQIMSYPEGGKIENVELMHPGLHFAKKDGKQIIKEKNGKVYIGNDVFICTKLSGDEWVNHKSKYTPTETDRYPGESGWSTKPGHMLRNANFKKTGEDHGHPTGEGEWTIYWWDTIDATGVKFDATWRINVFFNTTLNTSGDKTQAQITDTKDVMVKGGTKLRVCGTLIKKITGVEVTELTGMSSNQAIAPEDKQGIGGRQESITGPLPQPHKIIGYSKTDPCVSVVEAVGCFSLGNLTYEPAKGQVMFHVDIRNDSDVALKRNFMFSVTFYAGNMGLGTVAQKIEEYEFKARETKHIDYKLVLPEGIDLSEVGVNYNYNVELVD